MSKATMTLLELRGPKMLLEACLALPGSALMFQVWMVCGYGCINEENSWEGCLGRKAMGITGIDSVFQQ
jgi:hypothetical protein